MNSTTANAFFVPYYNHTGGLAALFPGFPRMHTENWTEREEPGEFYDMRNNIGGENLITSGCTTELAHTLWTKYTRLVVNACGQQNGTREQAMLHYLPVQQATASVHRPLHYATGNLLTWQMTPLHSNEWLSRCFTCQGGSFPGFIYSSLLCTLCSKKTARMGFY